VPFTITSGPVSLVHRLPGYPQRGLHFFIDDGFDRDSRICSRIGSLSRGFGAHCITGMWRVNFDRPVADDILPN
jgi:hypothetical protein